MAGTVALLAAGPASGAPRSPAADPFYAYAGSTPLDQVAPGTVLNTRKVSYHLLGFALPITAVQLAYRSTSQIGEPTVNVTSVLLPPWRLGAPKLISYQSVYDSLNPKDEPSYAISGGLTLGGLLPQGETALMLSLLLQGYTIALPDTEGQQADFAAGPEYGMNTLDGLRAAFASPSVGLQATTKAGLLGYSGGAIATDWAAELAPTYAPDVNARLVGAAFGGVLVDPEHNLHYVDGSKLWAGVMPMAIVGIGRAFHIDLTPYLSDYGLKLYNELQAASIIQMPLYSGVTWKQLAKPEYANPEDIPIYVHVANQLIMGTGGTPTVPLYIGQGTGGELEGTSGSTPGIGAGDGVMVAGDVRALAHQYCDAGVSVQYNEYKGLSHSLTAVAWFPTAGTWLTKRFGSAAPANNCQAIGPGNSIAPIPEG